MTTLDEGDRGRSPGGKQAVSRPGFVSILSLNTKNRISESFEYS